MLTKACRLGQLIGMEWSRPHGVRHLDTGDLRLLNARLQAAQDPLKGLNTVEALVRAKMGGERAAR